MSDSRATRRLEAQKGSVMVEAAASVLVFFLLLFGIVEFSYIYYQWNSAVMATQRGARIAAVSNPVAANLLTLTGLESNTNLPGSAMPGFDCICYGSTQTCESGPSYTTTCTWDTTNNYSLNAMKTILLGRGNNGTACVRGRNTGMCFYYPGLTLANIVVRYQYTGMGYAGRAAGPLPTITVSLQGLRYNYILLSGLARLTSVAFPIRANTTITGEDMRGS